MNSRMKDFYDLYRLLSSQKFDREVLMDAIANTFKRRQTAYTAEHPLFDQTFAIDEKRNTQWQTFLKKSFLDVSIGFPQVMQSINAVLMPIYQQLKPIDDK